jgi:hypothetical protein
VELDSDGGGDDETLALVDVGGGVEADVTTGAADDEACGRLDAELERECRTTGAAGARDVVVAERTACDAGARWCCVVTGAVGACRAGGALVASR